MKKQVAFTKILSTPQIGARCELELVDGNTVRVSRIIAFDANTIETKHTIYVKYNQSTNQQIINNQSIQPSQPINNQTNNIQGSNKSLVNDNNIFDNEKLKDATYNERLNLAKSLEIIKEN